MSPADPHHLPPFKNLFRITLPEAFLLMVLVAVALGIAPGLEALGPWISRRAKLWWLGLGLVGLLAIMWVLIEAFRRRCPFLFWSPYLCGFVIPFIGNPMLHPGVSLMLVAGIAAAIASLLARRGWWETAICVVTALAPLTLLMMVHAVP